MSRSFPARPRAAALCLPLALTLLLALGACGGGGGATADDTLPPTGQPSQVPDPTPTTPTPPATAELQVHAGDAADSAVLQWRAASGTGPWTLERWHEGDAAALTLATVADGAGSFADTGLAASTPYVYRLRDAAGALLAQATASTGDAAALRADLGQALGDAQSLALGAEGGQATAGALQLAYPAGTFAAGAGARVQAHAHTLADGVGEAWRIELDQAPRQPLRVALGYGADEDADEVDNQHLAARTPDGRWWLLADTTHDRSTRRLVVTVPAALLQASAAPGARTAAAPRARAQAASPTLQFDLVRFVSLKLVPREASVRVLGSVALQPVATWDTQGRECLPEQLCVPLVGLTRRDYPVLNAKPGFERRWLLEGSSSPAPGLGSLTPGQTQGAVYRAPATLPAPNPVAVRFESLDTRRGQRAAVSARVRVSEDRWVGPLVLSNSADGQGYFYDADTHWVLDPARSTDSVRVYRAQGTVKVHITTGNCPLTASPDQVSVGPAAGLTELEVDEVTDRYRLQFNAVWSTTITTCLGTPMPTSMGVSFDHRGTVGQGRIQGTHQEGAVFRQWTLTRPQ